MRFQNGLFVRFVATTSRRCTAEPFGCSSMLVSCEDDLNGAKAPVLELGGSFVADAPEFGVFLGCRVGAFKLPGSNPYLPATQHLQSSKHLQHRVISLSSCLL